MTQPDTVSNQNQQGLDPVPDETGAEDRILGSPSAGADGGIVMRQIKIISRKGTDAANPGNHLLERQ
ncbi:hypothetical protein T11_14667 [Trichinella zimbabwensis]|uniref:Uncharacterized protein n=1 Tax=Trichinella zimbabwensis TaxID=268475 RepID=A0A0V1GA95_9BILA|nr:hypothetical protein T11_14667 [Trichinella zimbabwensis]